MPNPYETFENGSAGAESPPTQRRKSLAVLVFLLLLTEILATVNTMQEGAGWRSSGGVLFILIAGISQLPGVLVGIWRWRSSSRSVLPMLFVAYLIAITGVAMYAIAASQTQPSDSMNNAVHMHVIFLPLLHCLFALVLYASALLASLAISLYTRLSKPTNAE